MKSKKYLTLALAAAGLLVATQVSAVITITGSMQKSSTDWELANNPPAFPPTGKGWDTGALTPVPTIPKFYPDTDIPALPPDAFGAMLTKVELEVTGYLRGTPILVNGSPTTAITPDVFGMTANNFQGSTIGLVSGDLTVPPIASLTYNVAPFTVGPGGAFFLEDPPWPDAPDVEVSATTAPPSSTMVPAQLTEWTDVGGTEVVEFYFYTDPVQQVYIGPVPGDGPLQITHSPRIWSDILVTYHYKYRIPGEVIPEPTVYGAAGLFICLGLAFYRRRRMRQS
jgi:hypothetical protein